MIQVEIKGYQQVLNFFEKEKKKPKLLLKEFADKVLKNTREFSPIGRSGELKDSWRVEHKKDVSIVYNFAPHAHHVVFGTHGYIRPLRARALKFGGLDGDIVFSKFVRSQEPNPFVEHAILDAASKINNIMAQIEIKSR